MNARKILAFAAIVEIATGFALLLVPALVVSLLLGLGLTPAGMPIARVAGAALLGLGLAAWPGGQTSGGRAGFLGMLAYNSIVAIYLAHLGVWRHLNGVLLWPGVALHLVVALLLLWTSRSAPRSERVNG